MDDALVERVARAAYCADEKMDADSNESHLGCYFEPFNKYATDETRIMMDDYRAMARAALAITYPAGVIAGREEAAGAVDAEYNLRRAHHDAAKVAKLRKETRDFETMMIAHSQAASAIRSLPTPLSDGGA